MTDVTLRYLLFGEDKTASKATEEVAGKAQAASGRIGASFSKMGTMIGGEIGEVVGRVGEGLSEIASTAKGMGPKIAAGGAAIGGLGLALSALGSANVEADNALRTAVENTGESLADYEDQIMRVVKANQNLAIGDDDTKKSLATLTQMTGSTQAALDKMAIVTDLAAARHISLESATKMVGMATNGNVKLFKTYGIEVESTTSAQNKLKAAQDAVAVASTGLREAQANLRSVQSKIASGAISGADAQKELEKAQAGVAKASDSLKAKQDKVKQAQQGVKDATDSQAAGFEQLGEKIKGSAEAQVDSFTGKLKILGTKIGDTVADFGAKYGPALQAAGVGATVFGTAMEFVRGRQVASAAAAAAHAAATAGEAAATTGATGATWGLNAALLANPVVLIVAGIIALVAALVLAWKHSETFREIVTAAFDGVKTAAMFVFNWIKDHWKLILAILTGPVGAAVIVIVSNWDKIRAGFSTAINGVKGIWNTFMGFLRGLPGKISGATSGMWNGIKEAFKSAINGIIDFWNGLNLHIDAVKFKGVTLFPEINVGTPDIPRMATGGVLNTAGSVIVGDGGNGSGAEILDLPAGARIRPLTDADRAAGGSGGNLGTLTVIVKTDTGEIIEQKLVRFQRDQGGRPLAFASR